MTEHSGQSISSWMATAPQAVFTPLTTSEHADVCIVGAGISGLTTAYLLTKSGKSVIVLDDGPITSGETERTTAHLSNALDDHYFELERLHGEEGARLAAESHGTAIDTIERIIRDEQIDCDFTRLDGYLFVPLGEDADVLEKEVEAARRAGLMEVELVPQPPVASLEKRPALRFPNQGQFHPLKYLSALATAIVEGGSRIYTQTHVTEISGGDVAKVETAGGATVTASAVVVATNSPINDRFAIHTKQAPYRTYVVALRIPAGAVPPALYWDTLDPYHYVRLQKGSTDSAGKDLLIVGGEDHKTGQADDSEVRYARLESWAREHFPAAQVVEYRWSGQVMEPVDGLAYIGRNPLDKENVYIATGDSGHGMTHGTIAGILLTDLINGTENPWASLYDPSRKSLRSLGEFTKENANVALQYTDWLTPGDVSDEAQLMPGQAAVVRHGLKKVAIYCDEAGQRHECSAVCPHLGGIVHWNHEEKSWDCPLHGSRFDAFGKVLNGPSISDLKPHGTAED